jgi:retron-type reverse transcriptase
LNSFRSAYRRGHSTETAFLCIANYVYHNADDKKRTLLLQLDLSAAFDVIDHETLLRRLEYSFRISGTILSWIRSYFSGRQRFVSVGDQLL